MPQQELEDFATYWQKSMFDSETGNVRPKGGSKHIDPLTNIRGVDYQESLIPWCKGNSVSVDHNTLQLYRNLMSALVENYRVRLRSVDSTSRVVEIDSKSGLTSDDLTRMYGAHATKRTRKHSAGDPTRNWTNAEFLFINLLLGGHIRLYSSKNTLSREESRIISDIQRGRAGDPNWMHLGICEQLYQTKHRGGHIRLSAENGWETYVGDHFGAPADNPYGYLPGSLQGGLENTGLRTMPYPLHICLAETLARAHGHGDKKAAWGKNQSSIRRSIADAAIEGEGDRLPLDEYYRIFASEGAAHMADSFFYRSIGDKSAARYELQEIPDSDPKKWDVLLEPEFIRWRELRRQRERMQ